MPRTRRHAGRRLRDGDLLKGISLLFLSVKSLAPIEIDRMKKILGIAHDRFETLDDLVQFLLMALELTLPDSVFRNFHIIPSAGNVIRWKWESSQCFAYKGMKQIGAIEGYRCGVMYRIECWLEALDVRYLMQPVIEGCLMHDKGVCEGHIQVFLTKE